MRIYAITLLGALAGASMMAQTAPPEATITNGTVTAKLYLPDAASGFYRGTRFDWSGVISSLKFDGHDFYGPWFTKQDSTVRDFVYRDPDIVVSSESGSMGPADEFQTPLGFDAAAPGGKFIKIGVGVLRRPDATPYSAYKKYEIVSPGKWTVKKHGDSVEFTQELHDADTGYGYTYTKTVLLIKGKPEMVISHSLKNTGSKPIETKLYNHNFLTLDQAGTPAGYSLTFPFEVKTSKPPNPQMASVQGNRITYLKTLKDRETVAMPVDGFGASAKDYDIRVENPKAGVGVHIIGDQPLASVALWSIRSVIAIEPFVAISAAPGNSMSWSYTYTYYTLSK
ncbi:MAG TPA: hypothetical protein VHC90_24425 [Bryobacteraceae bacterium]|nr:hypothetical protein [Bryobacteraceae bacterium]